MAEHVKVPLNEPGLVRIRENEDGTVNLSDLKRLRVVYEFISRSPANKHRANGHRATA
ncbi:hypothetical protein KKG31_08880 [Patescibacteria group bacterium]|nr:hypothetical protein [Patescibacteria group bacterium]